VIRALSENGCQARAEVLTRETTAFFGPAFELPHGLAFVADNVILLRYAELESEVRRVLAIIKVRDGDHTKNLLEVGISKTGITVIGKFSGLTGVLGGNPTLTPPPEAPQPATRKLERLRCLTTEAHS
jgi:circadian clock protein KaiC